MSSDIIAKCMGISRAHFSNTPYKEQTITEMYASDEFANRASGICRNYTLNSECSFGQKIYIRKKVKISHFKM